VAEEESEDPIKGAIRAFRELCPKDEALTKQRAAIDAELLNAGVLEELGASDPEVFKEIAPELRPVLEGIRSTWEREATPTHRYSTVTEEFYVELWNLVLHETQEVPHLAELRQSAREVWTDHKLRRWRTARRWAKKLREWLPHDRWQEIKDTRVPLSAYKTKRGSPETLEALATQRIRAHTSPSFEALAYAPEGSGPNRGDDASMISLMRFLIHRLDLTEPQAATALQQILRVYCGVEYQDAGTVLKWWNRLPAPERQP
jgi:hypothetical protein